MEFITSKKSTLVIRVVLQSKTGRVSCVCDWLRDTTGLDFGDRSWICNAAQEESILQKLKSISAQHYVMTIVSSYTINEGHCFLFTFAKTVCTIFINIMTGFA